VKWLDPSRHADVAAAAASEFRALEHLRAALAAGPPEITTADPVMCSAEPPALLMTFVEGASLEARLRAGGINAAERRRIAASVWEGVAAYHARTGDAFGDLHPGNVLVGDGGSVALLDPGSQRTLVERGRSYPTFPAAVDVASWLLSVGHSSPSRYLREWRLVARRAELAVEVVREAARSAGDGLAADSFDLVRAETRRGRRLRARLAGTGVRVIAARVVRRARAHPPAATARAAA
jgi:hypothetical protein